MVIEIDRKGVAKAKRNAIMCCIIYGLAVPVWMLTIVNSLRYGGTGVWIFIVNILMILISTVVALQTIRRVLRHLRTDHHLYVDETGVTMSNGHARVDIPWGDVEKISIGGGRTSFRPRRIKIQLRKESSYSKPAYRLYDEYEYDFDAVHEHLDEMWTAGQAKAKLLTI